MTARAAFMTGTVSVMRVVSSLATGFATTQRLWTRAPGSGGETRRVAVGADAQQDQAEPWTILGLEEFPQLLFVGLRRLIRRQLAPDPVDVRDGDVVE